MNDESGSKFKKIGMGIAAVAMIGIAVYVIWSSSGRSETVLNSTDRVFMCTETGKTFNYTLKLGDNIPVLSPYSGKKTGYEPERCYWTKDGKAKKDASYVLMNNLKGIKGPTFCPDCGRLVVGLNPPAIEGDTPPPTKAEYEAKRSSTKSDTP